MAAAKLVTRCPACRTAFRLVADQLRLRQGLVRCGQCDTVFDAREHLIELPAPEPAGSPETAAKAAGSTTAPAPAESPAHEAPVEHTHDEAQHEAQHEEAHEESHKAARAPRAPRKRSHADAHPDTQAHAVEAAAVPHEATHFDTRPSDDNDDDADESRPAAAPFDPGYDPGYDVPALDAPTVMLYQTQAEADEAVQASNRQAEPEAGTADSDTGEDEDEPSAVFVPGIVEGEEVGLAADADGAEADAPRASEVPAPAPEAAPWPQLDPSTLGDDDATHTADIADTESAADTAKAANEASATSHAATSAAPNAANADTAAIPSASGYLRAEAQDDLPEIPAAIAREQAERPWMRSDTPATPSFAPDFLRHARERDPGPARRKRVLQRLAIGFLVIAGLLQGTYLARSQLSGRFPVLRPAFEAACAPLGCEVAPWRDIDALRIESSLLQKQDEESDAYLLAVTLRNQGRATVALPAIELVMTDLQDQLLLRRVLQPADYLETEQQAFATHGLRAGTELPVRVRFRSQQAAANYRVLIFYP